MAAPPRKVVHMPKVRMLSRGGRLASNSNIRITNVRTIRPVSPETAKKHEEDKLRAQLQKEIVSRARTCGYTGYECWTPVVSGRRFCPKHSIQEPNSPYIQCNHTFSNGERCAQPAPRPKDNERGHGLCFEHARAALLSRQRSAAPAPPAVTTETLLTQLNHYVKPERPRTTSCASSVSVVSDPAEPEQASPVAVDPFKQMDATSINAAYSASIVECASDSDSSCDSVTLGRGGTCRYTQHAHRYEELPTGTHCKWRAGVYTAEEAVTENKSLLTSLQSLYLRQMDRLKVLLQSARLRYLTSLKLEKEEYCSINSQARSGPLSVRERRQLRKLKAYASYHTKHGVDALLARQLYRKRVKASESQSRPVAAARCIFSEGGVRCALRPLPAARHCARHVLCDHNQVLFKSCGSRLGVEQCMEPVAPLPLGALACRYHTSPPPYTPFTLKKEESESECESASRTDSVSELDQLQALDGIS